MRGNEYLFGIKELQLWKHRIRNSNSVPIIEWRPGVFMRKRKLSCSWLYMIGYGFCLQIERLYLLVLVVTTSAFLPALQTTACKAILGLAQSKNSRKKMCKALPLEWWLQLHFEMVSFMLFFTPWRRNALSS